MIIPTPRRVSSGKWYINMRLGGESVSVTENTKTACIKRAQLIKAEYLVGRRAAEPERRSCTLTEALDRYIAARASILSPATIRNYRGYQESRFQDVMEADVWECDEYFWQSAVNRESRSCSARTLKNAWSLMASAIYTETRQRFQIHLPQVIRSEHPWLTPEEVKIFVEAIRGRSYETAALLALCSLRRSEIKALRWQDIDLKRSLVHVRGSMVYNEAEVLVRLDTNKNPQSRRDVPMIPQLYDVLKASGKHAPSDPVVPLSFNAIFSGINRTCSANGLPEVGIHGLRHSFASLAYHLGLSEKVAMQIGGWADQGTMHKIYTHIAQDEALLAGNVMQEFYRNMQKNSVDPA